MKATYTNSAPIIEIPAVVVKGQEINALSPDSILDDHFQARSSSGASGFLVYIPRQI
jgi:hypothetical protein